MLSASIKQRINSTYAQYNDGTVELEARFGRTTNRGFIPGVSREVFNRIRDYFDQRAQVIETRTTDYISKNVRKTVTTPPSGHPETIWITKDRLWNQEDTDYGIRYSMSREIPVHPVNNFVPDVIREKHRYSYSVFKNMVQIDMTIVNMVNGVQGETQSDNTQYEVEVELVNSLGLESFDKAIKTVLMRLLDTTVLYNNNEANDVISFVNMTLNTNKRNIIDHYPIVQARNLKMKDMVWGGLIGNKETQYTVTHKADGQRKLLVFHHTGIWLVMAPHSLNRISPNEVPTLTGTIIDGELVPMDRRLPGAPESKLWYLAFDCLAWNGNAGVQELAHAVRMNHAQAVADVMKNKLINVNTKSFKSFGTPEQFFAVMREMFREQEVLSYKQDGFMFTPANTIYNPHSDNHPLYRRVLTDYPDICKWKPKEQLTIDFQIRWKATINGSLIQLYVNEKGKPILFNGTKLFPYDINMVDHYHTLTSGLPNNTVVEYGWDYQKGLFIPHRVRYDKTKPNKVDIAEDVWMDIQRPLDKDTMEGQSLNLMRVYHNKIKKLLFNNSDGKTLLDIGSGRGGDVAKWKKYSKIVAVEPNADHIVELRRRIEINNMTDKVKVVHAGGQDIEAIHQAVREFIGDRVDVVSMMLSMSFFWQNQSMVNRLVNTITSNIKRDGKIIFLTIDGDLVEQTFEPAMDTGPNLTKLELGPAILTYDGNKIPKELHIHIEDTIVQDQTEWLVRLSDLILPLRQLGFDFEMRERADKERFLNNNEITMTQMYTYAIIHTVNPNIKLPEITDVLPGKEISPGLKTNPAEIQELLGHVSQPIILSDETEKQDDYPPAPVLGLPPIEDVHKNKKNLIEKEMNDLKSPITELPVMPVTELPTVGLPTSGPLPIGNLPPLSALPPLVGTSNIETELPGIPVDTYENVNVSWYDNETVVRIGAIGDGSCFFHAVLNGYYPPYQNNPDNKYRRRLVSMLRRDIAYTLQMEDPKNPNLTLWETAANGQFAALYEQQQMGLDFNDIFDFPVDFSLEGLQRLFNSTSYLGNEVYQYASDMLGIDIYIMRLTNQDLYVHQNTSVRGLNRKVVVISGNGNHYETVGIERDGLFQTVFDQNDPFIVALRSLITDEGGA